MEIVDINNYLVTENLFELFKTQLKKDFEGAGLNAAFTEDLPARFDLLKKSIVLEIKPLSRSDSSGLASLLYRVDISEAQLQNRRMAGPAIDFEELLAELIIKRVLQKVILKKKFSA